MEELLYSILGIIIFVSFTMGMTQLIIFKMDDSRKIRSQKRYITILHKKLGVENKWNS